MISLLRKYWFDILVLVAAWIMLIADWCTKVTYVPGKPMFTIYTLGTLLMGLMAIAIGEVRMKVDPQREYVPRYGQACWLISFLWCGTLFARMGQVPIWQGIGVMVGLMLSVIPGLCIFGAILILGFMAERFYDGFISWLRRRGF